MHLVSQARGSKKENCSESYTSFVQAESINTLVQGFAKRSLSRQLFLQKHWRNKLEDLSTCWCETSHEKKREEKKYETRNGRKIVVLNSRMIHTYTCDTNMYSHGRNDRLFISFYKVLTFGKNPFKNAYLVLFNAPADSRCTTFILAHESIAQPIGISVSLGELQ